MPGFSKQTAPRSGDYGAVAERAGDLGGYTINWVEFREDIDATPLYKGLPDDRCQCPHWGYVLNGGLTFRFADHEESFKAGDVFYTPPGHVPVQHDPGTEILIFSPEDRLRITEEAMQRNMEALQAT
jgi:hypothetical protein